jgi:general secretion pathway protein D
MTVKDVSGMMNSFRLNPFLVKTTAGPGFRIAAPIGTSKPFFKVMPMRQEAAFALRSLLLLAALATFYGCTATTSFLDEGKQYATAGDWDSAVKSYQRAYQENPKNPETRLQLNRARGEASRYHMVRGEVLLENSRFDDAIGEFQISISMNPANSRAGELILKARNLKEAEHYFTKAETLVKVEKYDQARELFQKSLDLNPDNPDARDALAFFEKKEAFPPKFQLKLKSRAPISLKFKNSPILNVFEVLTKLSGINFIFDKDLQDNRVTLFMTDVSFDHFLEVLLKTSNLAANVVDEKTMMIYAKTPAKEKEYKDLQIRTFYLSSLEALKVVELLSKIFKSEEISANEQLNTIVVRGPKEVIELAGKIIEANDRAPAELLLNVEILEVSRAKEKQLGLDFNPYSLTLGIGETAPNISSDSVFANLASLNALGNISSNELLLAVPTVTLNFLKQDTDTRILAKPQLRVRSREISSILIGSRIPLRTNRRVETTGQVTNDFQYFDIGVKVDAEPTINLHGEISLKLTLELSALGPNIGTVDDPQFEILTRTVKTVMTVRDGEPVIIGGLIQDDERTTVRKLPLLGEVAALGSIFSNTESRVNETDVLFTFTPMLARVQEVPGTDVMTFWSGSEQDFSLREPYGSYLDRKQQFREKPEEGLLEHLNRRGRVAPAGNLPGAAPDPEARSAPESVLPSPGETGPTSSRVQGEALAWPASLPYSIQVNTFSLEEEAQRRLQELAGQTGFECFSLAARGSDDSRIYRVFVGKFKDYESAWGASEELKNSPLFPEELHVVARSWALGD